MSGINSHSILINQHQQKVLTKIVTVRVTCQRTRCDLTRHNNRSRLDATSVLDLMNEITKPNILLKKSLGCCDVFLKLRLVC